MEVIHAHDRQDYFCHGVPGCDGRKPVDAPSRTMKRIIRAVCAESRACLEKPDLQISMNVARARHQWMMPCSHTQTGHAMRYAVILWGHLYGGESGIRTHGTLLTYTRFPSVRLKPLGHLSSRYRDRTILSGGPVRCVRNISPIFLRARGKRHAHAPPCALRGGWLLIHLQGSEEGALRDFDLAELAHALLAFLLLFQQLALT